MARIKNEAGFSLVEMAVIVTVIGIMAVIGIPSFLRIMPRMKLNNATMILSNEISLARMRAIAKSADFRIVFYPSTDRYTIEKYDGAWKSLGTTILTGTDLDSVAGFDTADTLIARATGEMNVPLNTQASIELQTPGGDYQKRILVEPTGRVLVQRRMVGGSWTED